MWRCLFPGSTRARGVETRGGWKRSSIDGAPGAAHGCYSGSANTKGIIRVVHFDAYRETRGEADPVKRALDPRQSIDACAVLRQHRPTEPNDSAAEMPAGLRLQINIHRHAGRDVLQLCLAEVGDDVPGARIYQGKHLRGGPGEGAV